MMKMRMMMGMMRMEPLRALSFVLGWEWSGRSNVFSWVLVELSGRVDWRGRGLLVMASIFEEVDHERTGIGLLLLDLWNSSDFIRPLLKILKYPKTNFENFTVHTSVYVSMGLDF
ncbi:hypothetical protein CPB84DRAFT_1805071, partial [Gymnopilus junonius]